MRVWLDQKLSKYCLYLRRCGTKTRRIESDDINDWKG